jgi:hypothetical protein
MSKTGKKNFFEVAVSELAVDITGQTTVAAVRALLLANASTVLFGKESDGGKGLRKSAMFTSDPSGEAMYDGLPEYVHSVGFVSVGFDTAADNADRAKVKAMGDSDKYAYMLDPRTGAIKRYGPWRFMAKFTSEGTEKETIEVKSIERWEGTMADNVQDTVYGSVTPAASLVLLAPDGGETYGQGADITVEWSANFSDNIKVELFKGAVLNTTITAGVRASAGALAWKIPANQTAGADYKIAITRVSDGDITDISTAAFTIEVVN